MNYYDEIKNKLIDNEVYSRVKDYSKERYNVVTHYEVGKLLFEAGNCYGENVIGNYSKKLQIEIGKKYNERTLRRMRQLYLFFEEQKWSLDGTKLSLSHIRELFPLKNSNEIQYYMNICVEQNLTRDELKNRIKSNEYERLPEETKNKIINREKTDVRDFVKNPITIRNIGNYEVISEKILQRLILEDIDNFLKELGTGFCYIGSEYKIKLGDKYNYIDLLLYNIKYRCYVVIELKITELKKEHIGQIQTYMNYIDRNIKTAYEDKTIGIIIVKNNDRYVMEYCSDNKIITKEYIVI